MYDAREIANYFLDYADSKRIPLTNMGLLKVIYYAHGWHLARFNQPLILNKIEAWEHGPVVRVVYDAFKQFRDAPIVKCRAKRFDVSTNDYIVAAGEVDEKLSAFLTEMFDFYGQAHAFELSKMTHAANGPWDQVTKAAKANVQLQMEIPNDIIKNYFYNSTN